MKKIAFSIIISFYVISAFAQIPKPVNSRTVLNRGIDLYDNGKYDQAMVEYNKVNKSDSNYMTVLYEKALTYYALENYEKTINICEELFFENTNYPNQTYRLYGNSLSSLKRLDDAENKFKEGITKYPNDYLLHFNLGIVYLKQHKVNDAVDCFENTLKINPFHFRSHFFLGLLQRMYGDNVQAALSYTMALMLSPKTENSERAIVGLESALTNKPYTDSLYYGNAEITKKGEDVFYLAQRAITEKEGLKKTFNKQVKLKYDLVHQLQAMLQKLAYDENDKGFYMQFYVPIFRHLIKESDFPAIAYTILQSGSDKKVSSWVAKNQKEIKKAGTDLYLFVTEQTKQYPIVINGKQVSMPKFFYNTDEDLKSTGHYDEAFQKMQGSWYFFYPNTSLKSYGDYDRIDRRQGEWKFYYDNGQLNSIENYKNDTLIGTYNSYYSNGSIKSEAIVKNGVADGAYKEYFNTGMLRKVTEYANKKKNGKYEEYYNTGGIKKQYTNVDDLADGTYEEYNEQGVLTERSIYVKDKLKGKSQLFFDNGKVQEDGEYDNDQRVGKWFSYYENGDTASIGFYNSDGKKIGTWKEFYEKHIPKSIDTYENGIQKESKNFDEDGKIYLVVQGKKDVPTDIIFYDKNGKEFSHSAKKGNKLYIEGYDPNSYLIYKGQYTTNGKDDVWTYYYPSGKIKAIEYYKDGKSEGIDIRYYQNGSVMDSIRYKNDAENGYYIKYYKNGKKETEGWYVDGFRTGEWREYSYRGTLTSIDFYVEGQVQGYSNTYDYNGRKDYDFKVIDGLLEKTVMYDTSGNKYATINLIQGSGTYIERYPNGKIKLNALYTKGEKSGTWIWYHADSTIQKKETYELGYRNGLSIGYSSNNQLDYKGEYKYGKKTGKWEYYKLGKVDQEVFYDKNGDDTTIIWYGKNSKLDQVNRYDITNTSVRQGPSEYYNENGEWLLTLNYYKDVIISYTYAGTNGKPVAPIDFKSQNGVIKTYFSNGKPALDAEFKNGFREGNMTTYYSNGKVCEERFFKDDQRFGTTKYYNEKGELTSEEQYLSGDLNGTSIEYYPESGKVKLIGNYLEDVKNGYWYYYDKNGKLLKTEYFYENKLLNSY